jgi:ubiquinone/menaquinone biosynthesis C-methylase UbiE
MHQFSIGEQTDIHQEMMRVVKPGGFVISEFYGARAGRHPSNQRHQERYPSPDTVRMITQSEFQVIPLTHRGTQLVANSMGEMAASLMSKTIELAGIRSLTHEYFVIVHRSDA